MNRQITGTPKSEQDFRRLLDRIPGGAYICDSEGLITHCNPQSIELWGRTPKLNHPDDRFCGSFKLFSVQGTPIPHDHCWMAQALQQDKAFNRQEIVVERP